MAKSWELYQQPESGGEIPYALRWIAGASNPWVHGAGTLDKMSIYLSQRGPAGAKCRLGIYQNASDKNNKPVNLIKDAGELDIGPNGALKNRDLTNLNTNLAADTRYWAVLLANGDVGAGQNAARIFGVKPVRGTSEMSGPQFLGLS